MNHVRLEKWFYSEIAYFESFLDSVFPIETPAHISGAAFALNRLFLIQQLAAGKTTSCVERFNIIMSKIRRDHGAVSAIAVIELVASEVMKNNKLPRVYFPEIVSTPVLCKSPHIVFAQATTVSNVLPGATVTPTMTMTMTMTVTMKMTMTMTLLLTAP